MKLTLHLGAIILTFISAASLARDMPHVELVAKYMHDGHSWEKLQGCKSKRMYASANSTGEELNCWAAKAAGDLSKEPSTVINFVLNPSVHDAALRRCAALSFDARFKSKECAAAVRADTFIMLRLPRSVETLKPVTFKH
jgi:hypothetical protein